MKDSYFLMWLVASAVTFAMLSIGLNALGITTTRVRVEHITRIP